MKRIIAAVVLAAALAACTDETSIAPAISLISDKPEITDTTAIFRVVTAGHVSQEPVTIPVSFAGTATEGSDYTVSAHSFVCSASHPVDSIVVSTLVLGSGKTLSLSLGKVEGFDYGRYTSSEYTLQEKLGYFGFSSPRMMATDTMELVLNVSYESGYPKPLSRKAEVTLSIDSDRTTAEEGVHFTFPDTTLFCIEAGQSSCALRIAVPEGSVEEGKDKIVFRIGFPENLFGAAGHQEVEIDILGPEWKALGGSWQMDSLVTDSLYMAKIWDGACSKLDSLPQFNSSDKVTFDLSLCSFTPRLYSSLSDYFIGTSLLRKGPVVSLELGNGGKAEIQTFGMDKIDRWFSPREDSADSTALVGFRMIQEAESGEEMLDMYIIDHTSRVFMPELEERYGPEKPVAASPGMFLNAIFRKQ